MAEEKIIVPTDKKEVSKKVAVELEVDTSIKDLGPNPYAKLIHLARAVDSSSGAIKPIIKEPIDVYKKGVIVLLVTA